LVSQLVFVDIQSLVGLWAPQMDLLENEIISDVVVLSVVLEEVKNKNLSLYNRLRAIIDNPTRHFFVFANEHHK
jgi:exosome complex exonuclease DIS3/RRP44